MKQFLPLFHGLRHHLRLSILYPDPRPNKFMFFGMLSQVFLFTLTVCGVSAIDWAAAPTRHLRLLRRAIIKMHHFQTGFTLNIWVVIIGGIIRRVYNRASTSGFNAIVSEL